MILHTVNKSITSSNNLAKCLRLAKAGSAVVLMEDAVFSALANTVNRDFFAPYNDTFHFYLLADDLSARGISGKILPGFNSISYAELVHLSVECSKVQSWG